MNMARLIRLAKEGSWILAGQIAVVVGSLVLVRVLTEYLSPEEYGQLALGLTIATLSNQVVIGGISAGIGRFYTVADEENDLHGYLQDVWRLLGYSAVAIVTLGFIFIAALLSLDITQWVGLAFGSILFSLLSGCNGCLNSIQNAARQRAIVAIHAGFDAWLKIVLAVVAMLWVGPISTVVLISYACSTLLITTSQLVFLGRTISRQQIDAKKNRNLTWIREIWAYSWPMAAGGFFNWGYYASQRWALEVFATTEDVGRFYALTQVAYTPVSMSGALIMSFLLPILFARAGDAANKERIQNASYIIKNVILFGIFMTMAIFIFCYRYHQEIFNLLVSHGYKTISVYMPYIALSACILQVSQALGLALLVEKKTKEVLPLAVVGQSYIAIQNLFLTYMIGFDGIIISMVLGSIIHMIWMYQITSRNSSRIN